MALSLMAASLGLMSMKGLLPIPMDTISCMRKAEMHERRNVGRQETSYLMKVKAMMHTSISESLSPQDLPDDGCPHGLDLPSAGLEYKGVLRLPPAEPNLEAQAAVAHVFRHSDLCRLRRNDTETEQTHKRRGGRRDGRTLTLKDCL